MKFSPGILLVPILLLITGCSSHGSSGYGYGYGHRGHVSVGVNGHSTGAAVVGALIVGGVIGAIIADSKNQQAKQQVKQANILQNQSGTQNETEYQAALSNTQSDIQWYQYGKDGKCYLMGVDKGVTDVVSAVPKKKCEQ